MPAPLAVDREAVKAHAITHGVREAARAYGLKPTTVMQWSAREKWLARPEPAKLPPTVQPQAVSGVSKPSEAARSSLERLSERSKLNAAKTVDKGFRASAKLDGESILHRASDLAALAKVGQAVLPGWKDGQGSAGIVGLQVTVRPTAGQVVDVQAVVQKGTEPG